VAIYESVFNMLESVVPEFDGAGLVRGPSGSTLTGIVPTNTYPCADGKFVIIGGNGDSIFQRLMRAAGRDDLADDPRLADNAGRVTHQEEVDDAISRWTATLGSVEVLERLAEAGVPSGPIYSVEDMMADPQYQARGMFETVQVDGEALKIPAIAPVLDDTPGETLWPGPALGEHNEEILGGRLGYSGDELRRLADDGVI
jgi:crotonobetainyl-CoA:carnitine CoA-transferase CaiB-like acyl-CoA transferase